MVSLEEAILLIIERGTGVIGPTRMSSLVSEAGINISGDKVQSDDLNKSFQILTENFAAIAPTTRITLMALSKMYDFEIFKQEREEKKEKNLFLRLKNWKLFKR
ncbi:MAG: hypothetical protein ACTSQE_08270 [Candidatus Heimdallarchaeaceae archaeon]